MLQTEGARLIYVAETFKHHSTSQTLERRGAWKTTNKKKSQNYATCFTYYDLIVFYFDLFLFPNCLPFQNVRGRKKKNLLYYFFGSINLCVCGCVFVFVHSSVKICLYVCVLRDTWKKQVGPAAGTKHFFMLPWLPCWCYNYYCQ